LGKSSGNAGSTDAPRGAAIAGRNPTNQGDIAASLGTMPWHHIYYRKRRGEFSRRAERRMENPQCVT
jgi:hypothetical protein